MSAIDALAMHKELVKRREYSESELDRLKRAFSSDSKLALSAVTFFCAGSLGRLEAGKNSDLDIFVVSNEPSLGKLKEVRLLAGIADLNDDLKFPSFSDEMRYMKVYQAIRLIDDTGRPRDDSENSFTTRMLLLLESAPLGNQSLYLEIVRKICENYFRDNKGKKNFRPLFLINDLLRFWRTLCLNYEQCRDDPAKPWRKKNINLRFSRLTTVFSTIAMLMVDKPQTSEALIPRIELTPLQRLAMTVDVMKNRDFAEEFPRFLDHYATFLRVKDNPQPERLLEMGGTRGKMKQSAEYVADYFHRIFCSEELRDQYRYLLI